MSFNNHHMIRLCIKLTNVLISSEHVGNADYGVLHNTSVGLDGITGIVLYHTITAVIDGHMRACNALLMMLHKY